MPQAPEVISGLRQPRTTRMESMAAAAESAQAVPNPVPSADPSITVYVSRTRRYRVQITAPASYVDPATGRKMGGGKRLEAQFEEGVYRNDHRDPAIRKLIDETLQSNPYFGKFGSTAHYWLASEQQARMDSARIASALDTLKALPKEVVDGYVAQLRQGAATDHELPPADAIAGPGAVSKGIRPITQ